MFWNRRPKKWSGAPKTTDEAFSGLPTGYRWNSVNRMDGHGWYASVKCKDGWEYSNFSVVRVFASPLEAMQDALAEAWKKYELMDAAKESARA